MAKKIEDISWRDLETGCIVKEAGSAREYLTGSWRSRRPIVNKAHCLKCGVCWLFCPDSAIVQLEDRYFEADLNYCKGCGICAHECPSACISMHAEEEL
ncbi:MAG: pyruvate synthase subunit PorD [Spirochaetes bacterium]|nr:MAG: pyruvate synthase subunit PorD [Spirochaetota bacterium]